MTSLDELTVESPVGFLRLTVADDKLISLSFSAAKGKEKKTKPRSKILKECENQLKKYFSGGLKDFDLPLQLDGTDFRVKVWNQLLKIPYGETISYLELARELGDEKCIRAAASSNGKNPVAIIVPCHRVIGSNKKLVGYGGGLWRKDWLLKHEKKVSGKYLELF